MSSETAKFGSDTTFTQIQGNLVKQVIEGPCRKLTTAIEQLLESHGQKAIMED